MWWNRQNVGPIGIDIGARSIRALQLRRRSDALVVTAAAEASFTADAAQDADAIKAALRKVLAHGRFIGKFAATSLPADSVELRSIRLPNMPEAELEAAAAFEARERFPNLQDDYEIRTLPAGEVGRDGAQKQQEMIVLAARRSAIDARLKLLTDLGLLVTGLEPGTNAFFRPFERFMQRAADATEANAFVDLGLRSARVIITRGREVVFLKACPFGGEVLDEAVAERLSLSVQKAGDLRRRCWSGEDDALAGEQVAEIAEAVRPTIEQLGKEISLCLRYYGVTFRGERPESVTCGGSEARYAQLLETLSKATQMPFRVGHALRSVSSGTAFDAETLATGLPEWTTAMGLALRDKDGEQKEAQAA